MNMCEKYRYSAVTLNGETAGFSISSPWPLRLGEIHVRLCDECCDGDNSKCQLVWKDYFASDNVSVRKTVLVDEFNPVLHVVWAVQDEPTHGRE